MNQKIVYSLISLALILCSCNNVKKQVYAEYSSALENVAQVEKTIDNITAESSRTELIKMMEEVNRLEYTFNPMGLDSATISLCKELEEKISLLKKNAIVKAEDILMKGKYIIAEEDDIVVENKKVYPVYLERGEKLVYDLQYETTGNLKIYSADTKKLIRSRSGFETMKDSLSIAHTGIYLIQLQPQGTQYLTAKLYYKIKDRKRIYDQKKIIEKVEECSANSFMAEATRGIQMKNIFEQPKKVTLRSALKSVFSGNWRVIIPVVVPAGTTDILYSVRISTSEQDRSSDGDFYQNMNHSYKEIRFMDLPVYKSTKSAGILNMILDDNRPITDEDAYCNMYVFRSSTQAKKFQDEDTSAKDLQYDLDYSNIGTQSCDGRIPVNDYRKIYLGFENERVRYSAYLWVEAIAAVPTTEYHHTIYSLEK